MMEQECLKTPYQLYRKNDSGTATNGNMTSYISSPDSQYSTLSNKTSDKLTIKKTTGQ